MSALFFRRAFSDHQTLLEMSLGLVPDYEAWRRRMYLLEQREVVGQPDHLLKGYRDLRFSAHASGDNVEAFGKITWTTLENLADRFIERHVGEVRVKKERFQEWHDLITHVSPLSIAVAFLVKEGRLDSSDPRKLRSKLIHELGDTALLSPYEPIVEHLIESEGLNEMHMHLNGSTEMDLIWPNAVQDPLAFKKELDDSGEVRDQYENILPNWTAEELSRALFSARRMRHVVWHVVAELARGRDPVVAPAAISSLMNKMNRDGDCIGLWKRAVDGLAAPKEPKTHPVTGMLGVGAPAGTLLHDEALFLFLTLKALRENALPKSIAMAVFFVFCVQRQIIELSVQQLVQYGFDQFQKITLNEVRSLVELTYEQRFKQLNQRPPFRILRHLEGRFAPKADVKKLEYLLERILDGAYRFRSAKGAMTEGAATRRFASLDEPIDRNLLGIGSGDGFGRPDFELSLVAHFIKKQTRGNDPLYLKRRTELRREAAVLFKTLQRRPALAQIVRGVDAAANELHTPPEVFAPTFRQARHAGIPHATFHAGEDFQHLIGGIRAVYDAVLLTEMRAGDRIGHATALGIRPSLWLERAPERVLQMPWDTLIDLVFARSLLFKVEGFSSDIRKLEAEITDLSAELIGKNVTAPELEAAFSFRDLDALEYQHSLNGSALGSAAFENRSRSLCDVVSRKENARIAAKAKHKPHVFELFIEIQSKRARSYAAKPREFARNIITPEALSALQSQVIQLLNSSRIIVETLPTSNLRISLYDRMSEHHLFRWLGLTEQEPLDVIPDFCVGSDDPGIFATSLKNEFAIIANVLRCDFGKTDKEIAKILSSLNKTAHAFRFKPDLRRTVA